MRILVTAGPTREPIDPVRFISNRSSGKMGYAVAEVCIQRGHEVLLVSGPVHLAPPPAASIIEITTAQEMLTAVTENITECNVLVMAAAVADWRPSHVSRHKLKKNSMATSLALERTPDILAEMSERKHDRIHVGFAAETQNLVKEASRKLETKKLDLVVANDVSRDDSGFETDTNKVTFVEPGGKVVELPVMTKLAVADKIADWLEARSRLAT